MSQDPHANGEALCREAARLRKQWQQPENIEEATRLFEQAVAGFDDLWMGHYGLGEILLFQASQKGLRSGPEVERALALLKKAATMAPDQPEPILALSSAFVHTDLDVAARYYRQATELATPSASSLYPREWPAGVHWAFAIAAADGGREKIAVEAFCRAIELNRTYGGTYMPATPRANACWKKSLRKQRGKKWWQFWKTDRHRNRLGDDTVADSTERERIAEQQEKKTNELRNYNLLVAEFFEEIAKNGHRCANCGTDTHDYKLSEGRKDHLTGVYISKSLIICHNCGHVVEVNEKSLSHPAKPKSALEETAKEPESSESIGSEEPNSSACTAADRQARLVGLRPLGNKKRLADAEYATYLLFRDKGSAECYYRAWTDQARREPPPSGIEVLLGRLADTFWMAERVVIAFPSPEEEGVLSRWAATMTARTNEKARPHQIAGGTYESLGHQLVAVYAWDIIVPQNRDDLAADLFQDDEAQSYPLASWPPGASQAAVSDMPKPTGPELGALFDIGRMGAGYAREAREFLLRIIDGSILANSVLRGGDIVPEGKYYCIAIHFQSKDCADRFRHVVASASTPSSPLLGKVVEEEELRSQPLVYQGYTSNKGSYLGKD